MKHHEKMKHMKKKKAMKAEGEHSKPRLDKYARGGGMKNAEEHVKSAASASPASPLSGAGKMSDRAGLKASTTDREDD